MDTFLGKDFWRRNCAYLLDILDNQGFMASDLGEEDEEEIAYIRSMLGVATSEEAEPSPDAQVAALEQEISFLRETAIRNARERNALATAAEVVVNSYDARGALAGAITTLEEAISAIGSCNPSNIDSSGIRHQTLLEAAEIALSTANDLRNGDKSRFTAAHIAMALKKMAEE